jgi:hypothetical protein
MTVSRGRMRFLISAAAPMMIRAPTTASTARRANQRSFLTETAARSPTTLVFSRPVLGTYSLDSHSHEGDVFNEGRPAIMRQGYLHVAFGRGAAIGHR